MWRRLLQVCWIISVVQRSVPVSAATKETELETMVPDYVSIVTEISVQEIVDGQIIQRKPTQEELRLVQDKILGRRSKDSKTDNDISATSTVEDLSSILKPDSSDADPDLFDDWMDHDVDDDEDEVPSDMEAILRDDFDENPDKTRDNIENALDEKYKNNLPNEKSITRPGNYRKFYHTEKKNFSNVKDIKIMISEKEGDFFEDDEDSSFFMQKPSSNRQDNFLTTTTQASVPKQDTDKFDSIKKILASVKMAGPVNSSSDFNETPTTSPFIVDEDTYTTTDATGNTTTNSNLDDEKAISGFHDISEDVSNNLVTTIATTKETSAASENAPSSVPTTAEAAEISTHSEINEEQVATVASLLNKSNFPTEDDDEEAISGSNDFSEDALYRGQDDPVPTTLSPQETTAATGLHDPISEENTSSASVEISTYSEIREEQASPVNIIDFVTKDTASGFHDSISEENTSFASVETSTHSEIREEQVATVASPVNKIDFVTEDDDEEAISGFNDFSENASDRVQNDPLTTTVSSQETTAASGLYDSISEENASSVAVETFTHNEIDEEEVAIGNREEDTATSTILPVTLESNVSFVIFSETDVYVAATARDSERAYGYDEDVELPTERTTTKFPDFSDDMETSDGEALAENGVSVQDISEIISLAENSYHEITGGDLEESDISNINRPSVFEEPVVDVTSNSHLITDTSNPVVTEGIVSIHSDTSTGQIILGITEETTSIASDEVEVATLGIFATSPSPVLFSSSESSFTTENWANLFIVTAVDYTEAPTESVNIDGSSTETIYNDSTSSKTHLGVVDQTTQPTEASNTSHNTDTDEVESHNLSPSDVESILNAQLEDYEEDDYDNKEGTEGWTVFGGNDKEHSLVNLGAIDENILVEDQDSVVAAGSEMTPVLRTRILNKSAEFSVKISKKDDTFYIPATAYVKEYGRIVNITWRATANQNNSLAMRVFENQKFYIIKEIILYVFAGNRFSLQKKLVAINPDPILDDTMPGRIRGAMMRDGTYITFSNVEFLKISEASSDRAENSASASRNQKLWQFEVASISIATVLIVAIALYVIALKTKTKITLREKDELPQVTSC